MKHKVCFFLGNADNAGGAERVSALIANALAKRDFDVTMVSLYGGMNPYFPLDQRIELISLNEHAQQRSAYFTTVLNLRKVLKSRRVATLIAVDSILALYCIPAAFGLNVRRICWEQFNFKVSLGKKARILARYLSGICGDTIVALTERDRRIWQNHLRWSRSTIVAIPNPSAFPVVDNEAKFDNKVFLAVGRLTREKGFDLLLEAWRLALAHMAPGWCLKIVGSGECAQSLHDTVEQYALGGSVTLLPAEKNIASHYASASYYIMSSRFEGFGLVLVEAHSFGLPIISFDCEMGPAEIISDRESGWLCPAENVSALAAAIVRATWLSSAEYKHFSHCARARAKCFDVDHIIGHWVRLIRYECV